jgi:hypothetical protein
LCWGFPCNGYQLLTKSEGRFAARVGYGLQERPSQFLAALAISGVPANYPVRVGEDTRTVADLVEYEKLTCRAGTDMSLKLIALSNYIDGTTWKNGMGESWSVDRIVKEELARPSGGPQGITRILGLSFALTCREKRKVPIEGDFGRAKKFVDDYQNYALELQSTDGSWEPQPLLGESAERTYTSLLSSSGQMAEWLAMSLPKDRLEDARMSKAVEYLDAALNSQHFQGNVSALSSRDIAAVAHATHALMVYDSRVFKPADVEPAPAASEKKTAMRQSSRE